MIISTVRGPSLPVSSGTSTVPSFEIGITKTTSFRKKPIALASSLTPYQHSWYRHTRTNDVSYEGRLTATMYALGQAVVPSDVSAAAERAATTKLLQKIKGETLNLSTFIGELPETCKWFKDTLKTVVSLYRAVRRGNMKKLKRFVKRYWASPKAQNAVRAVSKTSREVSGRWLEWRYAITPLMLDFDALRQEVYDARNRMGLTRHVSSHAERYFDKRDLGSGRFAYADATVRVTKGCYVTHNANADAFKRLGLLNPVATLWELTPLSFVIDWFLPIGDYLSSLDAMVGVSVTSTWMSNKQEGGYTLASYQTEAWGNSPVYPYPRVLLGYNRYGAQTMKYRRYTRTTPSSLSLPRPNIQRSLSSLRLFDAVALARQSFKG